MADPDARADRLDEYATRLETTDPEAPLDDVRPLVDEFRDASVVGLGESTHGTREFFRLKHRLFRLLVEELDCRVFALEANFTETLAIDDYVVRGEGDPVEALEGIHFWTWNVESVLAMIEWMRAFNEGRPADDRIRFYGIDAQFPTAPAAAVADFLRDVDPAFAETVADDLDLLIDDDVGGDRVAIDPEYHETAADLVDDLATAFDVRRDEWAAHRSASEVELARQHLRTLDQTRRLAVEASAADDPTAGYWVRDEAMAENVAWIREHESADVVAVWAHNGHVFRDESGGSEEGFDRMGSHLADRFGDAYYPLGFDFSRGSFRAFEDPDAVSEPELRAFEVDDGVDPTVSGKSGPDSDDAVDGTGEASDRANAADGSDGDGHGSGDGDGSDAGSDGSARTTVNEALASLPGNAHFLDVAGAAADPALSDWLDRSHPCRHIGAVVYDDESQFDDYHLPGEVDGLLFVTETTSARPIDGSAADG